jgi:hypothetical protein
LSSGDERILITIGAVFISFLMLAVVRKEIKDGKTTSRHQVCRRDTNPLGFWFTIIFRLAIVILTLYAVYAMNTG